MLHIKEMARGGPTRFKKIKNKTNQTPCLEEKKSSLSKVMIVSMMLATAENGALRFLIISYENNKMVTIFKITRDRLTCMGMFFIIIIFFSFYLISLAHISLSLHFLHSLSLSLTRISHRSHLHLTILIFFFFL
uniref:Uncharacterized protein n=1 Tax=Cacopsylla melanoneura TaxID=428564 RepID=A0A8D8VGN0_9HEMI